MRERGRGWFFAILASLGLWGAIGATGCALTRPASPGYILCNEMGNETGCGDNVAIEVN